MILESYVCVSQKILTHLPTLSFKMLSQKQKQTNTPPNDDLRHASRGIL